MWPEFRNRRLTGRLWNSIVTHDLLLEVSVRVVLLLAVCVLQVCIKPHKRYISVTELLRYYKYPRQLSIFPAWATVFVVIGLPMLCFVLPEFILNIHDHNDLTQCFLAWTLALSINAFITEVVKLVTGRPRPDFFYRCYPDGKINIALVYLEESSDIWEGRKSFPSGHSSFAFCSMGFVSLWLCGQLGVLSRRRGQAPLLLACFLPLLLATAVAISRCCDNHHHWEDVATGSVLGFVVSYLSYNQYFYPIDSELSGRPILQTYHSFEHCIHDNISRTACCTNHLHK